MVQGVIDAHLIGQIPETVRKAIANQSNLTDEQLRELHTRTNNPMMVVGLKKFEIPFIKSHVAETSISAELRRALLKVGRELDLFNQQVDFAMTTADKTFDPATMAANEAILTNLNKSYEVLAQRAEIITNLIVEILNEDGGATSSQTP